MPLNRDPRVSWIPAIVIGLLGGCAGARFTEADREQTRIVDLGSTFSIALPSTHEWAPPILKGASVQLLHRAPEESSGTTVFQFQAQDEGESEILIRARPSLGADLDFNMRVRVVEPPEAESALDDDWRERWGRSRFGRDD